MQAGCLEKSSSLDFIKLTAVNGGPCSYKWQGCSDNDSKAKGTVFQTRATLYSYISTLKKGVIYGLSNVDNNTDSTLQYKTVPFQH